jgi:serine/threonine-protein kinase
MRLSLALLWLLCAAPVFAGGRVVIDGNHYDIGKKVGQGWMSEVYEGIHANGHKIALKFLWPERDSSRAQAGLHAELEIARRAIGQDAEAPLARAVGIGHSEDAKKRIVLGMEWVSGTPLGHLSDVGHTVAPDKAVRYIRRALRGLGAMHAVGHAHRDLHYGNLLVAEERTASLRVIDTGEAAPVDDAWGGNVHRFNAPAGGTNRQADLYHAGALLRGLITGDVQASSDKIPDLHVERNGVRVGLREVIDRATAADPAKRFQSAEEMAEALRPFKNAP